MKATSSGRDILAERPRITVTCPSCIPSCPLRLWNLKWQAVILQRPNLGRIKVNTASTGQPVNLSHGSVLCCSSVAERPGWAV